MSGPGRPAASSGDATMSPDETPEGHEHLAEPSRRFETVIATVALALSVLALVLSRNIHLRMGAGGIDPKWWPTLLSLVAAALSAVLLAMALFGPPAERDELESTHRDGWARMLVALALSVLYIFAWSRFGYVAPTLAYLLALLWLFGVRNRIALVLYPVITTAFIYGLFRLMLRVPL